MGGSNPSAEPRQASGFKFNTLLYSETFVSKPTPAPRPTTCEQMLKFIEYFNQICLSDSTEAFPLSILTPRFRTNRPPHLIRQESETYGSSNDRGQYPPSTISSYSRLVSCVIVDSHNYEVVYPTPTTMPAWISNIEGKEFYFKLSSVNSSLDE